MPSGKRVSTIGRSCRYGSSQGAIAPVVGDRDRPWCSPPRARTPCRGWSATGSARGSSRRDGPGGAARAPHPLRRLGPRALLDPCPLAAGGTTGVRTRPVRGPLLVPHLADQLGVTHTFALRLRDVPSKAGVARRLRRGSPRGPRAGGREARPHPPRVDQRVPLRGREVQGAESRPRALRRAVAHDREVPRAIRPHLEPVREAPFAIGRVGFLRR